MLKICNITEKGVKITLKNERIKICTMYYFPVEVEKDCGRFPVMQDQSSI